MKGRSKTNYYFSYNERLNLQKINLLFIPFLFFIFSCSASNKEQLKDIVDSSRLATPNLYLKKLSESASYTTDTELHKIQLILTEGSTINIYYQTDNNLNLAINIANMVREFHKTFTTLFTQLRPVTTNIILIDKNLFYIKTASPSWVQALFYKEHIYIPTDDNKPIDYMKLYRSLKHEYSHAVIYALSSGSCPGWIDEGIAQWFEGVNIETKRNVLKSWLKYRPLIPLKRLHKGFISLPPDKAQIGYAQSLFAVEDLIKSYGISRFNVFFQYIQVSYGFNRPFLKAFGISEKNYEAKLDYRLRKWVMKKKKMS